MVVVELEGADTCWSISPEQSVQLHFAAAALSAEAGLLEAAEATAEDEAVYTL
jgi:hypothetical protein